MDKSLELWTVPQIAKSLGITPQAVRVSILHYDVPYMWVGKNRVLTTEALNELLRLRAENPLSLAQQARRQREQKLARKNKQRDRG